MDSISLATLSGTFDREWSAEWRHDEVVRVSTEHHALCSNPFGYLELANGDVLNTYTFLTDDERPLSLDSLVSKRVSYRLRLAPVGSEYSDMWFDRLMVGERVIIGPQHNAL